MNVPVTRKLQLRLQKFEEHGPFAKVSFFTTHGGLDFAAPFGLAVAHVLEADVKQKEVWALTVRVFHCILPILHKRLCVSGVPENSLACCGQNSRRGVIEALGEAFYGREMKKRGEIIRLFLGRAGKSGVLGQLSRASARDCSRLRARPLAHAV
jgi:hypothetical protein